VHGDTPPLSQKRKTVSVKTPFKKALRAQNQKGGALRTLKTTGEKSLRGRCEKNPGRKARKKVFLSEKQGPVGKTIASALHPDFEKPITRGKKGRVIRDKKDGSSIRGEGEGK